MFAWWLTGCKMNLFYLYLEGKGHSCKTLKCPSYMGGINTTKLTIENLTCYYVHDKWEQNILSIQSGGKVSSWTAYLNDFWSIRWTSDILWTLKRWNCSNLSIMGMCRTIYIVSWKTDISWTCTCTTCFHCAMQARLA